MEEIEVHIPFNKENFIKKNHSRWHIESKKSIRNLLIYTFIAAAFFYIAYLANDEYKNTNPFLFFAEFFGMGALYIAYTIHVSKNKYYRQIESLANKYDRTKAGYSLLFSDNKIKYVDEERLYEIKWSLVSSYAQFNEYLIIRTELSNKITYMIDEKEVDKETYKRIIELLQQKVKK